MRLQSRRALLATALSGAAGALLWPGVRGLVAQTAAGAPSTQDLGNGIYVLPSGQTNVLAVTDSSGVALVDGGAAADAAALAERVAGLPSGGKVHTLFNTHWHPEHTGSNERLAQAGAKIVSQVNTKLWLGTDVTWPWNDETVQPLPKAALPSTTFFDHTELTVGGRTVQCGHLRDCPHTDGDMYVYFPEPNVMAIGDAVYGQGWPMVDWWTGGWIGGLVGGLDILLTVANDETRFVPAHGPVLDHAAVLEQYRMYGVIWERMAKLLYTGAGPEDAVAAAPTKEFDAKMGPSDEFVRQAFQSMWAYLSPDA